MDGYQTHPVIHYCLRWTASLTTFGGSLTTFTSNQHIPGLLRMFDVFLVLFLGIWRHFTPMEYSINWKLRWKKHVLSFEVSMCHRFYKSNVEKIHSARDFRGPNIFKTKKRLLRSWDGGPTNISSLTICQFLCPKKQGLQRSKLGSFKQTSLSEATYYL